MDPASIDRLSTARLTLKSLAHANPDALVAGLNDVEVARWLARVPHPYTRGDADEMMSDWEVVRRTFTLPRPARP